MRDWLSDAYERRPYHPFLITPQGPHSFEEVEHRVRAAVGGFQRLGIKPGDRLALWARNDLDSVVAAFAIPRSGATLVLLNTRLTAREAGEQARMADVVGVVGDAPGIGVASVEMVDGPAVKPGFVDPLATHSIVFTSGSNGAPKGVRLTWRNLEASAAASAAHLSHVADDRWLAVLPIYHVGGFMILVRSARQVSSVLLEPGFDAHRAADLLRRASLASLVPLMLRSVLDSDSHSFAGVRAVLVGGGACPRALLERAASMGLPVLPTYGMTETASQIATARLSEGLTPRGPAVAVPGAKIRVGEGGRIAVSGPMVSPGYLGAADRTSEWFETGDIGEIDEIGRLRVLGRADDVIVTGGENVHPLEVESVLKSHPDLSDVVVLGLPDPRWGDIVVAVFEGPVSSADLERKARYGLAGFKVPRRWIRVDELPRLSIGKVDRAAVKRMVE